MNSTREDAACGDSAGPADALPPDAAYEVAGFCLRVFVLGDAAPAAPLIAPIDRLLGRFRTGRPIVPRPCPDGGWSLRIDRQAGDARRGAEDLRQVWAGPSPAGFHVVNSVADDRRRCELAGVGVLDVDLSRRTASITLLPQAQPNSVHYFLTTILCEGLTAAGHCVVHAACLQRPTRDGLRSMLVVAGSGTGKSTTALALTGGGWRLMGDDIAVLTSTPEGVRAWGFPRFCNVRRPTLALLPWLAELPLAPTSVPETFALPLEHLGDRVCSGTPAPAVPEAIICLERPNAHGHRLVSLDKAAALMHVAEENVQPIEGSGDAVARRSFRTFAELVRTTPAFSLSAGPQLDSLGAALGRQLGIRPGAAA